MELGGPFEAAVGSVLLPQLFELLRVRGVDEVRAAYEFAGDPFFFDYGFDRVDGALFGIMYRLRDAWAEEGRDLRVRSVDRLRYECGRSHGRACPYLSLFQNNDRVSRLEERVGSERPAHASANDRDVSVDVGGQLRAFDRLFDEFPSRHIHTQDGGARSGFQRATEEKGGNVYVYMADWSKLGSRGRVEDRRGFGPAAGGLGVGGIALLLLLNFLGGGDVADVLPQLGNALVENASDQDSADFEGEDSYEVFASTVVGSNNDMWRSVLAKNGIEYREPKLVLFRGSTQSACGGAASYVGPHYCPSDETIYLDETFFEEMKQYLGAEGGDVAEAYVMAHEVAHHAQHQLGVSDRVERGDNAASVKLELQADCFAGLWAYSIRSLGVFGEGEINEAIDAARSVGDDRIQQRSTGAVDPESWTHGSSAERVAWFNRGYETGSVNACDTFAD